jgi:mitogen-activated protein kinase kinase 1
MEVRLSDLLFGSRIGQGACSTVSVAKHKQSGELYAVKMFNVYDRAQAAQLQKEIALLTRIKDCDALISLKGAFHTDGKIGMILEYMDRGSLSFLMDRSIVVNEVVFAAMIYQVLWGLGYLHYDNKLVSV